MTTDDLRRRRARGGRMTENDASATTGEAAGEASWPEPAGTIDVDDAGNGNVRVQCDRPGERAVSAVVDARGLIEHVAAAAGLTVTVA